MLKKKQVLKNFKSVCFVLPHIASGVDIESSAKLLPVTLL